MNKTQNILENMMIEVELKTSFSKLKETLTRFGIANRETKTLTQSVHVLKKRGKIYLCHFKLMFELDGRESTMTKIDWDRFYMIVLLMEQYGLVKIINGWQREEAETHEAERKDIFIISKKYVQDGWTLKQKYLFGKKS